MHTVARTSRTAVPLIARFHRETDQICSHQAQEDAPDVLTGHICTGGIRGTIRVLVWAVRISIFLLNWGLLSLFSG